MSENNDMDKKVGVIDFLTKIIPIAAVIPLFLRFFSRYSFSVEAQSYFRIPRHYFQNIEIDSLFLKGIIIALIAGLFFFPYLIKKILKVENASEYKNYQKFRKIISFFFAVACGYLYYDFSEVILQEVNGTWLDVLRVLCFISATMFFATSYYIIEIQGEKEVVGCCSKIKNNIFSEKCMTRFLFIVMVLPGILIFAFYFNLKIPSPREKMDYEIIELKESQEKLVVLSNEGSELLVCRYKIIEEKPETEESSDTKETLIIYTEPYFLIERTSGFLHYRRFDSVKVKHERLNP